MTQDGEQSCCADRIFESSTPLRHAYIHKLSTSYYVLRPPPSGKKYYQYTKAVSFRTIPGLISRTQNDLAL